MISKKLNLGLITSYPTNSGIGVYSNNLYDLELHSDYFFFNFRNPVYETKERYREVRSSLLPRSLAYALSFYFPTNWSKVLERYNYVHLTSPDFFHLVRNKKEIIGTLHDAYFLDKKLDRQLGIKYKTVLNYDSEFVSELLGITAVSNVTAQAFKKKFQKINPKVIHNWTSDIFVSRKKVLARRKLNIPYGKFMILNVGANTQNKNLKFLSTILSKIKREFIFFQLNNDKITILDSGRRIILQKKIDEYMLSLYYNSADLYISTSIAEGFNFPIIEAINSDLPVIASDIPIFKEILHNSPYLLSLDDESRWVANIEEMIVDSSLLSEMQIWYRHNIDDYYRKARAKIDFINFYSELGIRL